MKNGAQPQERLVILAGKETDQVELDFERELLQEDAKIPL